MRSRFFKAVLKDRSLTLVYVDDIPSMSGKNGYRSTVGDRRNKSALRPMSGNEIVRATLRIKASHDFASSVWPCDDFKGRIALSMNAEFVERNGIAGFDDPFAFSALSHELHSPQEDGEDECDNQENGADSKERVNNIGTMHGTSISKNDKGILDRYSGFSQGSKRADRMQATGSRAPFDGRENETELKIPAESQTDSERQADLELRRADARDLASFSKEFHYPVRFL